MLNKSIISNYSKILFLLIFLKSGRNSEMNNSKKNLGVFDSSLNNVDLGREDSNQ